MTADPGWTVWDEYRVQAAENEGMRCIPDDTGERANSDFLSRAP